MTGTSRASPADMLGEPPPQASATVLSTWARPLISVLTSLPNRSELPTLTPTQLGGIMAGAALANQWERALTLLHQVESCNAGVDKSAYTKIMRMLSKYGCWKEGLILLQHVDERRLQLTTEFHNHLMYALIKGAQQTGAVWHFERVFRVPGGQGGPVLQPDVFSYSYLLTALADVGDVGRARRVLQDMASEGVAPDKYCYMPVLKALSKQGLAHDCGALLKEARVAGIRLDAHMYSVSISACAASRDWQQAEQLVAAMEAEGVPQNSHVVAALATTYKNSWKPQEALRVLKSAQQRGISLDVRTYTAVMQACACCETTYVHGRSVWHALLKSRQKPDLRAFNAYLNLLRLSGDAVTAWEELRGARTGVGSVPDIVPDIVSYNTVLAACEKEAEVAADVLVWMSQGGPEPDGCTCEAALRIMGEASGGGGGERGEAVAWALRSVHTSPQEEALWLDFLVRLYTAGGRHKEVLEVWALGDSPGIRLEPSALERVMGAALACRDWPTAAEVYGKTCYTDAVTPAIRCQAFLAATLAGGTMPTVADVEALRQEYMVGPADGSQLLAITHKLVPQLLAISATGDALALLSAMGALELRADGETFAQVMDSLAEAGDADAASSAVALCRAQHPCGCAADGTVLLRGITALGVGDRWQEALELLNSQGDWGIRVDTTVLPMALSRLLRAGRVSQTVELVERLRHYGVIPDDNGIVACLQACVEGGHHELALSLLQLAETPARLPPTSAYNLGMRSCVAGEQLEAGLALLRDMWAKGVPRDAETYGAVMALALACGEWVRCAEFVDVAAGDGVQLDLSGYNTALLASAGAGDLQAGLQLLRRMGHEGVRTSLLSFNVLLNACRGEGDWELALLLLDDLKAAGLRPDVVTYSTAISVCAKEAPGKCWELFQEMQRAQVQPNSHTYSAIIASRARWTDALNLLEEAKGKGLANAVVYSAAIAALGRAGEWDTADRLLSEMRAMGLEANDYAHSAVIWGCINAQQYRKALQVFQAAQDAMLVAGAEPRFSAGGGAHQLGQEAYYAALSACRQAGWLEEAMSILRDMQLRGVERSLAVYNLGLELCDQHGDADQAAVLLAAMLEDQLSPSVVSYNRLLSCLQKQGQWERAEDWLRRIAASREKDAQPNVHSVVPVLGAVARGHSVARALRLLEEFPAALDDCMGLPGYNALVGSLHADGMLEEADAFYRHAHSKMIVQHWASQPPWEISQESNDGTAPARPPAVLQNSSSAPPLDLHGLSMALAGSAVRCALDEVWRAHRRGWPLSDLTIITGVGRGSSQQYQPVLRPEVQRMLMEEFYPPIATSTVPGNSGRLTVSAADLQDWIKYKAHPSTE